MQKYQFGLAIDEPRIVIVDGPYPASASDITIFRGGTVKAGKDTWDRNALYFKLPQGKKLVADGGYGGEPDKILLQAKTGHPSDMNTWIGQVKARQETMHAKLRNYHILRRRFYHGNSTQSRMDLHQTAVEAICVLVQYAYENGHPPFDIEMPEYDV